MKVQRSSSWDSPIASPTLTVCRNAGRVLQPSVKSQRLQWPTDCSQASSSARLLNWCHSEWSSSCSLSMKLNAALKAAFCRCCKRLLLVCLQSKSLFEGQGFSDWRCPLDHWSRDFYGAFWSRLEPHGGDLRVYWPDFPSLIVTLSMN